MTAAVQFFPWAVGPCLLCACRETETPALEGPLAPGARQEIRRREEPEQPPRGLEGSQEPRKRPVALADSNVSSPPDGAYLKRILAAASFDRRGADREWHTDVHPQVADDIAEAERVFRSHQRELLTPLVPYLRTFDGKEYPQMEVTVIGGPGRLPGDNGLFHFFIRSFATLRPWGEGPRPGGMKPLVDETHHAWVEWDPKQSRVTRIRLSGLYRALPREALDRGLEIAAKQDSRYTRAALVTASTGWEPAWFKSLSQPIEVARAPKAGPSDAHLVVLVFAFTDTALTHREPRDTVWVALAAGQVARVKTTLVDTRPRYDARSPGVLGQRPDMTGQKESETP